MNQKQKTKTYKKGVRSKEDALLQLEARYCSWGDTVHYAKSLNIFKSSEGIYLYDKEGTQYLTCRCGTLLPISDTRTNA